MDTTKALPQLDDTELRVLGSLMEKSRTTPEYYPMTVNSLVAACNQKSSRRPVVSYDELTVRAAIDTLKKRGLVSTATGGTDRAVKYKHNFAVVFPVIPAEVAIICLLILRGPQTAGELNANSGRLYSFESISEIQQLLEKLSAAEPPYLAPLARRPGQKEARYRHLLGGSDDWQSDSEGAGATAPLEARVAALEEELAALRQAFDNLMQQLS